MQTSDSAYLCQYNQVAKLLLLGNQGEFSSIPGHYIDSLEHEFCDGNVSLVSSIFHADDLEELTESEVDDALDMLHRVDPQEFPSPGTIQSLSVSSLLNEEYESSEEEYNFVEDNLGTAEKTEKVLRTVIESVFKGDVEKIRDLKGKYPSVENDFLRQEDGTFAGTFHHQGYKFLFEVAPTEKGWICTYRMHESSLDSLPQRVAEAAKREEPLSTSKAVRNRGW